MRLSLLAMVLPAALAAQNIDEFRLPPKTAFPREMPRYPNVWFYVDASLAKSHKEAVRLVTRSLHEKLRLPEFYPPFDNPEGCDFEVRVEHLQPWIDGAQRQQQHAHAFHMRYYYSALNTPELQKVRLARGGKARDFYRFGASVHYEVEHANPNHADVEACPICGRTGEYAAVQGNLVEQVHDPLGLELLLKGTIRGQEVRHEDWQRTAFGSVARLSPRVKTYVFPGQSEGRNTLRIGIVEIR
jgi:hypothetical protein